MKAMARHVAPTAVPTITALFTQPPPKLPLGTSSDTGPADGPGLPAGLVDGAFALGDGDGDGVALAGAGARTGEGEGDGVKVGGATAGDDVGVAAGETVGAPIGACAKHAPARRAVNIKS